MNFADFARSKQGKPPAPRKRSIASMAVSLGKAAASTAARAVRREPVVAPEILRTGREQACACCDLLRVTDSGEWCDRVWGCGCYLPAKRALVGPEITCPRDLWPDQSQFLTPPPPSPSGPGAASRPPS